MAPVAVEFSADGRLAYVVNQNSSQLSVVDVAAGHEIAVIGLGIRPNSVALLPGGRGEPARSADNNGVAIRWRVTGTPGDA